MFTASLINKSHYCTETFSAWQCRYFTAALNSLSFHYFNRCLDVLMPTNYSDSDAGSFRALEKAFSSFFIYFKNILIKCSFAHISCILIGQMRSYLLLPLRFSIQHVSCCLKLLIFLFICVNSITFPFGS